MKRIHTSSLFFMVLVLASMVGLACPKQNDPAGSPSPEETIPPRPVPTLSMVQI